MSWNIKEIILTHSFSAGKTPPQMGGNDGRLVGRNVSKILPLVTDIYASIKTHFLENEAWIYRSGTEV